jgi:hypothetical protein
MRTETLDKLIARAEFVLREKGAEPMFKRKVRARITVIEAAWKKHLLEEGGSCYCIASDESCAPQVIAELKKILEF